MEKTVKEGKISIAALLARLFIDFLAMCVLIGFVWIIRDIIWFLTTKLTVTNKSIVGKVGLIHTNELNSPLNKVTGVQVKQGFLGKTFNYGIIHVTTASTSFDFNFISNPNEFAQALNDQIEKYDDERINKQAEAIAKAIKK